MASDTSISLIPSDTAPAVGDTITADVLIHGNPGFHAMQFTVEYDPAEMACTSIALGSLLDGSILASNPHGSNGAIIAAASALPRLGDGRLATLTFQVCGSGGHELALRDIALTGSGGERIPFSVQNDSTGVKAPPASLNTTPGAAEIDASAAPTFFDVNADHWAFASIQRAAELGFISGYNGAFRPDDPMTRAEFVTLLWRLAGAPEPNGTSTFSDVAGDSWYQRQIAWAAEQAHISGVSDTAFAPDALISREQVMTILFRYSGGQVGMEAMLASIYDEHYTDSAEISAYAKNAVYWSVYNGIVTGVTDTALAPKAEATRAQVTKILLHYIDRITGGGL